MIKKIIDGNKACASIAYLFTDIAAIYPITPSSNMAEYVECLNNMDNTNVFGDKVELIQMQSEAGAIATVHGALINGSLGTTFTSSQGLLLMIPNMYKIAGELLPGVIHVASRSIATHALSIFGDHQDIYATRSTGFALLSSSSVQQAHDLALVAHLSSIKGSLPFLHFFEGFRTSHELQKIDMIKTDDVKKLIDYEAIKNFRNRSLINNPRMMGTSQTEDIYFQMTEARNKYYDQLPDIVNEYMQKVNELTNNKYAPFNYYGSPKAKNIIVAMGSICDTIKETIDVLKEDIGLIEVHLYRPLSSKYFFDVLPKSVKKIAVLDCTKEAGSSGEPLYLDIVNLFQKEKNKPLIIGGRYGLSSKNTNPSDIYSIYEFLKSKNNFTGFTVGINDDVTKKSIPFKKLELNSNALEIKIYGYGSDGMTTTASNIIELIGNNTEKYVQGYFKYDSKKSRGTTISHLRISDQKIQSRYYVESPNIVICSNDSYLNKYDMLKGIKDNGIFILNTNISQDKLSDILPKKYMDIILNKHLNFYIINAQKIALDHHLSNKISMILETVIFEITKLFPMDKFISLLELEIEKLFSYKGEEIVKNNILAIKNSIGKAIKIDNPIGKVNVEDAKDIFETMESLEGDNLPVSSFISNADGTLSLATSQRLKPSSMDITALWHKDKCIKCNICSFVCPHAVVRPFLLNEEEYQNYENKENTLEENGYHYAIGISRPDCTSCGLCAGICPTNAITMTENNNDDYKYLFNKVTQKPIENIYTIKNSQFQKPLFEFSGACAGCGETAYIKLLTQLVGDKLIIANATGCSSIYGGSSPINPYSVPWANSLFEDNAEFGLGIYKSYQLLRNRCLNIINTQMNKIEIDSRNLFTEYMANIDSPTSDKILDKINFDKLPIELQNIKNNIKKKSIWCIGGDGWAYDIGYGGIDHILSQNENVNILVLDSEVYSNTGGQASKSTKMGAVAQFAATGKKTNKKDLARMAMNYDNVYVATICLGANMMQAIKAIQEAIEHQGPSIIIAYSPCIAHGIIGGLKESLNHEKKAVECGYFQLYRYNRTLHIDSKEPKFDEYEAFLCTENRFSMLKLVNEKAYQDLLEENKNNAKKNWEYLKLLAKE